MTRLVALFGIVLISFSAIFIQLAAVPAATAAFYRCALALPLLFGIWLGVKKSDVRAPRERLLAFVAGLFLGVDLTFWSGAILEMGAGLSTVIANSQVVFVALLGWLVAREWPTRVAFFMMPLVFVGVGLVAGVGGAEGNLLFGSLLALGSAVTYAAFLVTFRSSNKARVHPAGPLLDATVGAAVAALALGLSFDPSFSLALTTRDFFWLAAVAVVSQVVAWLMISYAIPRLAALETSILLLLQPAGTLLWGYVLLGESLSWSQGIGALVVLSTVGVLSVLGAARRDEARPAPLSGTPLVVRPSVAPLMPPLEPASDRTASAGPLRASWGPSAPVSQP